MQKDAINNQVLDQGCSMRLPHRHIGIHSCLLLQKAADGHKMSLEISEIPWPLISLAKVGTSSSGRTKGARSMSSRGPWHWNSGRWKKHNKWRWKFEGGITIAAYIVWHLFPYVSSRIQAWQVQHNKSDGPEQCNIPQKHPVHFPIKTARPWHTAGVSLSVRKSRWFWHGQCLWPQSMDLQEFHAKLKMIWNRNTSLMPTAAPVRDTRVLIGYLRL